MLSPNEERWVAANALADRIEMLEEIEDRQWSVSQARYAHNNALIADKHNAERDIADFDREAEAYGYGDAASAPPLETEIGRLGVPNAGLPAALDIAIRRDAERRLARALKAMKKHQKASQMPAGRVAWSEKLSEVRRLISSLAKTDASVELFSITGRPSRKAMLAATRAADAADAEREKVLHARPTLAEAKVLARAAIRSTPPVKLAFNDFYIAREAHVPTVALAWRDGNTSPSAIDLADMLGWLAGQRIEDEIVAQLERRYNAFADRGALTMTEAERRRELARLDRVIHEIELEEAAHMLGVMEAENGVMFYPRGRMSARALLGIV